MTISGLANNAKKLVIIRILAFRCLGLNSSFVGRKEINENETKIQIINKIKNLFQTKEFNSREWKNGDYQTRGEMVSRTLIDQIYQIKSNHQEEK